jgi:phosphoribosylformimino-5-aminoimidazole carboxamide ribotide isomerase
VNIIASGGISRNEDIAKVKQTGAYAVILGKALYDGKVDIKGAKGIGAD